MRDLISLTMALFGIVNIAAGSWGAIYLIETGYHGAGGFFLCALAVSAGFGLLAGAMR